MKPTPTETSNVATAANHDLVTRRPFSPRTDDVRQDVARLYRSMSTYDIAQLLHVRESNVWNLVFGKRAAALRQHNAGANGSVQARQERNTP